MYTLNRLWKYNDWANERVIKTFEEADKKIPSSSLRLLSHIVNTQTVWVNRIIGEESSLKAWDEHALAECKKMHQQSSAILKDILDHQEENLFKLVEYKTFAGQSYNNELFDILLHALNHGTYHRGQIAQEMRSAGLEPVGTDYITFVR